MNSKFWPWSTKMQNFFWFALTQNWVIFLCVNYVKIDRSARMIGTAQSKCRISSFEPKPVSPRRCGLSHLYSLLFDLYIQKSSGINNNNEISMPSGSIKKSFYLKRFARPASPRSRLSVLITRRSLCVPFFNAALHSFSLSLRHTERRSRSPE